MVANRGSNLRPTDIGAAPWPTIRAPCAPAKEARLFSPGQTLAHPLGCGRGFLRSPADEKGVLVHDDHLGAFDRDRRDPAAPTHSHTRGSRARFVTADDQRPERPRAPRHDDLGDGWGRTGRDRRSPCRRSPSPDSN
jgi:hypothetical protein